MTPEGYQTKIVHRDDVLAKYCCDGLSRRTLLTLGNDANVVYEHDLAGRLTKLTNHIDDANGVAIEESAFANPYLFTGRATMGL